MGEHYSRLVIVLRIASSSRVFRLSAFPPDALRNTSGRNWVAGVALDRHSGRAPAVTYGGRCVPRGDRHHAHDLEIQWHSREIEAPLGSASSTGTDRSTREPPISLGMITYRKYTSCAASTVDIRMGPTDQTSSRGSAPTARTAHPAWAIRRLRTRGSHGR